MKFTVNENVLKNTTKCKDSYSCLDGKRDCLCSVEDCADGKIHFIRPRNENGICEYKMKFGYSFTCNCSIRKEIYNHYKI
jgi:hypothetical protein